MPTGRHAVIAMFHSTAMVADYDRAVGRLGELFGLRSLECTVSLDPRIARRGGMTWIGDGSLEIGEPTVEGAAPDRFVRATGGGMQGIALWVEDFEATVAHLEAHGVTVPVRMPSGFGFSSPRTTGGLQFEWSSFTVEEDPRLGAQLPPLVVEPVAPATHQAFVAAVVDEPVATAERFAAVLGLPVVHVATHPVEGEPHAVLSLGDCVLALHPFSPERSAVLWARSFTRPSVAAIGLRVEDLAAARAAVEAAGARVVRAADGAVVLEPATTGDVGVVLVDDLLPGDPRRG